MKSIVCLTVFFMVASLCYAGNTRFWSENDHGDFEKGNLKGLSLRSDGRLMLAPVTKELFDSATAYLWTLARDSHGIIYAGGGPGARLFRMNPNGGGSKIADFDALEIHAIVVDRQDRVYVATSPDGKVYRLSHPADSNAKPEVFYDPKQKYIWAMVLAPDGNLYIATGDAGEIHRVTPDGKGSVFFKSEETHARSLAIDGKGNLIAGTEPGGLVLRIDSKGEGFVLYQMPKRETTAVAVGPDGSIYAAGVGTKQGSPQPAQSPQLKPVDPPQLSAAGTVVIHATSPVPPPTLAASTRTGVSGGSDVWRIYPDGHPERVFASAQDVIYAIAFDRSGHPIAGSGNKGTLYRIDSPARYTSLLSLASNQITAIETTKDGAILACTGNVGKVYQFGPEMEKSGSIESDVFDAGGYTYWGRIAGTGDRNGGTVTLGGLQRQSGSAAEKLEYMECVGAGYCRGRRPYRCAGCKIPAMEGNAACGDRRYVARIRIRWTRRICSRTSRRASPRLKSRRLIITCAAPVISLNPSSLPVSLSLPPIGRRKSSFSMSDSDSGGSSMSYAKGWLGARWNASDENGDDLAYKVEVRGVKEAVNGKLLKDNLRDRHFS